MNECVSDAHSASITRFPEWFNGNADGFYIFLNCCHGLYCGDYTFIKSADCRDRSCSFRLTPKTIYVPLCVKVVLCNTVRLLPQAKKISSHIQVQKTLHGFVVNLSLRRTIRSFRPINQGTLGVLKVQFKSDRWQGFCCGCSQELELLP